MLLHFVAPKLSPRFNFPRISSFHIKILHHFIFEGFYFIVDNLTVTT